MSSHSEDSDDAPEEISFQTGKDSLHESENLVKKHLLNKKKLLKASRKNIHERNLNQKKEKEARIKEIEDNRLPLDLLQSVHDATNNEASNNVKKPKKLKKRKKETEEEKFGVQVKSLSHIDQKAEVLASKALNFRNKHMKRNSVKRISSHSLRMMGEKQQKGGRTAL